MLCVRLAPSLSLHPVMSEQCQSIGKMITEEELGYDSAEMEIPLLKVKTFSECLRRFFLESSTHAPADRRAKSGLEAWLRQASKADDAYS